MTATVADLFHLPFQELFNIPQIEDARRDYLNGSPFPHLVIDNFFQEPVAQILSSNLKSEDCKTMFEDKYQKGKMISIGEDVPSVLRMVASRYSDPQMLNFLESVTGENNIICDPYYNTLYGYYHIVTSGGVLGSHVDHSHHSKLQLPHVLNIVVYLTPDWSEEFGGSLCLYDQTGKNIIKKVASLFNRAVIFACHPSAYHGVEPVKAGLKHGRHSIYMAYYATKIEKNDKINRDFYHGTDFVMPVNELLRNENRHHLNGRLSMMIRNFCPPIIYNKLKGK